jgi:uroporphyrinogen-III decarboxylase
VEESNTMIGKPSAMSSRERVLAAIRRQPVDYVPCAPLFNPLYAAQRRGRAWNFPWDPSSDGVEYLVTVLGVDPVIGDWWLGWFYPEDSVKSRVWQEGALLHKAYDTPSGVLHAAIAFNELWPFGQDIPFFHDFLGHYVEPWLKSEPDLACLRHILLPPRTQEQVAQVRAAFRARKALADRFQLATTATVGSGLTSALWMFGAEGLGLLTLDDPGLVQAYLDLAHQWALPMIEILLDCGVDIIQRTGFYETCDYYSPAMLERFLGEALRQEIEIVHQAGRPYSYILYSGVMPMLDYLARLDFDCMSSLDIAFDNVDLLAVNAKLGDRRSFWTGPSNTFHMYATDPEVVRQAVRDVFAAFGRTGLIVTACSSAHPMMPWESTLAMVDEWKKLR